MFDGTARAMLPAFTLLLPPLLAQQPAQELDFDRLRQLIEQSRAPKELSPEEQRRQILTELRIDRSPSGILAVQLEEARLGGQEPTAPPAAPTPEQELELFRRQADGFRRDLTLGRWDKVAAFFDSLPPSLGAQAYQLTVAKLVAPVAINPPPEVQAQGAKAYAQPAYLPPQEWLGLAAAAPAPPEGDGLKFLARLLPSSPPPPRAFFDALTRGIRHFGGEDPKARRLAAQLLIEADLVQEAGPFLPDLETARSGRDYAALNLIARHRALLAKQDPQAAGTEAIPLAWELSTSFLTDEEAPAKERSEALFRALSVIPELGDDRGRDWLESTFQNPQGGGLDLLATLGTLTAQNRENPDEALRLEQLRLQHAAVKAVLSTKADPAAWSTIFNLYARQWAHEAEVTRLKDQNDSRRMIPQYDPFGNVFYMQNRVQYDGQGTKPIASGDLLECRPDGGWLEQLETTTYHQCLVATARLLLKVKEEDGALPLVQALAASRKEEAISLVREVIQVWGENHNPNREQDYRSRYMYYYGYNQQAGSIPLTRSKQERNLVELAALVKGIRSLELGESFHQELADAFIACHSRAEVWRVEAIESVFGEAEVLESRTLSSLVDRMRGNLAGLWPDPKLQQAYQTKRKDKELQEQILEGYTTTAAVLERALERKPAESWRLAYQLAALRFEESNYRSSLAPDQTFSAVKRESLDRLAQAAQDYASTLPLEDQEEESAEVFETWFFASLGSPSLEALKAHHLPTLAEYPKIKAALESLPGDGAERHLKKFATTLNQRLANVSPDLKLRYLEAADAIVGGRKEMADASDVLAYYRDLVTEIELSTRLDGSDRVSRDAPFGLQVNLRHTREIEREAGGFQRYLQNQTNATMSWNFGRPPEDYRDKFEKAARAVLEEHFTILSLTFHSEKVESRTDPQFGWRLTPYAYFLLQPKGPEVDRIPPLKIDLDFMDTSGYAVIPIASAEIPIAVEAAAETRPYRELRLTQTLDERSSEEKGSLFVDVKVSALGLVPPLEDVLDLSVPGFEVGQVEDRGVRIAELDGTAEDLAPVSEAEWRIEFKPVGGRFPETFRFPAAKVETAAEDGWLLQRYVDVDLVPVASEVSLAPQAASWSGWLLALLLPLAGVAYALFRPRKKPAAPAAHALPLPSHFTPVSVLGYLRKLRDGEALTPQAKGELDREIRQLESQYFGPSAVTAEASALQQIAARWQEQAA